MESYANLTDAELTDLMKSGSHPAFAEIYQRYKYILHAHALNKLHDREEALDIIQEVFTYLWRKREIIQFTGNISGYLYGAVRHAILNKITREQVQKKYTSSMKAFASGGQVITDHLVREKQLKAYIEKEIMQLPPKMREVFELSRKEYLSHKEIAERLGITEQTVSKQITNALKILKVKLGIFIFFWLTMHP